MKTIYLYSFALCFILQSCNYNTYLSSTSTDKSEVINIAYFDAYAGINLIQRSNQAEYNDSLSVITRELIDSTLSRNKRRYKLSDKISVENEIDRYNLQNEFFYLIQSANNNKSLQGLEITPTLDSLLESNNQRFGMLIYGSGFGRRKGNYANQIGKGVATGILTLGMYTPIPVKSNISFFTIIVDSKKNEVTYFKRSAPAEKSPTEFSVIKYEIDQLFSNYLYLYN